MEESTSSYEKKVNEDQVGSIVALGNVLLDIVLPVGQDFLAKCELQPDTTTLALDKHLPIFDKILNQNDGEFALVKYSAGGCAANTIRVSQWILGGPSSSGSKTIFVGAVGDDVESKKLKELLTADGITVKCQTVVNSSTGRCLVFTNALTRTLLTQLGASLQFSYEKFMDLDFQYVAENARVIYISGYFLRVSVQTVRKVAEIAICKKIPIVLNLNAVWVVETFFDQIMEILPHVDYIIANEMEAISMSNMLKLQSNDSDCLFQTGKYISQLPKISTEKSRTMLITRGKEPVVVVEGQQILEFPTIYVPDSAVVDTNGAGDAFAGGFLAGLLKQECLTDCVNCGIWAASKIIQQSGCNFPQNSYYMHNSVAVNNSI